MHSWGAPLGPSVPLQRVEGRSVTTVQPHLAADGFLDLGWWRVINTPVSVVSGSDHPSELAAAAVLRSVLTAGAIDYRDRPGGPPAEDDLYVWVKDRLVAVKATRSTEPTARAYASALNRTSGTAPTAGLLGGHRTREGTGWAAPREISLSICTLHVRGYSRRLSDPRRSRWAASASI